MAHRTTVELQGTEDNETLRTQQKDLDGRAHNTYTPRTGLPRSDTTCSQLYQRHYFAENQHRLCDTQVTKWDGARL